MTVGRRLGFVVVVAGSWGVLRIASAADTATVAASVGIVVSRV